MKKLAIFVLAVMPFLLTSCATETTVNGVIFDATMNYVTFITPDSDTIMMPVEGVENTGTEGVLLSDGIEVVKQGDKFVSYNVIPIIGKWIKPINGMDGVEGISLEDDFTANSINMSTLVYSSWERDNGFITVSGTSIGNGQSITFTEKWNIISITKDELIVDVDGTRFTYKHN